MDRRNDDASVFFASLAQWDRPESELRAKILPAETDVDALIELMFPGL